MVFLESGTRSSTPTPPRADATARPCVLIVHEGSESWRLPDAPFRDAGCVLYRAKTLAGAEELLYQLQPDLVFLPASQPGESVVAVIERGLAACPTTKFVTIAENDQISDAARAMRAGAFDCLFVPLSEIRLRRTVDSVATRTGTEPFAGAPPATPDEMAPQSRDDNQAPVAAVQSEGEMIGSDAAMRQVFMAIETMAGSDATVFIRGETGTGKELCARAIHRASPRANHPFVAVDCSTLRPETLNQQLHGIGRWTEEDAPRPGLLESAQGGVLYLDEICDLDIAVQPQLMRVLQNPAQRGVAAETAKRVDVRIICATSRDPEVEIHIGRLRPELYYRLHVAPLSLPPLRARGNDIAQIAGARLKQISAKEGAQFTGFSPEALKYLMAYPWPGNVRQLLNLIRQIVLSHKGKLVEPDMLPEYIRNPDTGPAQSSGQATSLRVQGRTLAEIERDVIEAAIRAQGGSVPHAARVLDVSPSTLYRKRKAWAGKDRG